MTVWVMRDGLHDENICAYRNRFLAYQGAVEFLHKYGNDEPEILEELKQTYEEGEGEFYSTDMVYLEPLEVK